MGLGFSSLSGADWDELAAIRHSISHFSIFFHCAFLPQNSTRMGAPATNSWKVVAYVFCNSLYLNELHLTSSAMVR